MTVIEQLAAQLAALRDEDMALHDRIEAPDLPDPDTGGPIYCDVREREMTSLEIVEYLIDAAAQIAAAFPGVRITRDSTTLLIAAGTWTP